MTELEEPSSENDALAELIENALKDPPLIELVPILLKLPQATGVVVRPDLKEVAHVTEREDCFFIQGYWFAFDETCTIVSANVLVDGEEVISGAPMQPIAVIAGLGVVLSVSVIFEKNNRLSRLAIKAMLKL